MPEPFLDRIREATVELSTLDLDALKAAAASASTGLTVEQALTLVRVAHRRAVSEDQDADLRQRINSQSQLVTSADQQLLAVLAGESLVNLFARTNAAVGVVPALAVRCGGHIGWTPVHPDVATHAEAYLRQRSVFVRRRLPPASRLVTANPKGEEGSLPRAQEEHETLRSIVQADRDRLWEREELTWWLLSETRPPTALGVARELASCLIYLPEPISTSEMIAAKLCRPHAKERGEASLNFPEAISDLHPDLPMTRDTDGKASSLGSLGPSSGDGPIGRTEEAKIAHECLDAILLIRAYEEAKK